MVAALIQYIHNLDVAPQFLEGYMAIILVMAGAFVMHFAPERCTARLKSWYHACPLVVQALVLAIVIFIVIQMRQTEIMPFIYFQY